MPEMKSSFNDNSVVPEYVEAIKMSPQKKALNKMILGLDKSMYKLQRKINKIKKMKQTDDRKINMNDLQNEIDSSFTFRQTLEQSLARL